MLTAALTQLTPHGASRTSQVHASSLTGMFSTSSPNRCASDFHPYSVKYRRFDSPAAACCSLQPQRSVPEVNRAVNPLKMRRCQQATHMRLMTFVRRDFLPHLHCSLRLLSAGCCGSYWKAFRLHILERQFLGPAAKHRRWMKMCL